MDTVHSALEHGTVVRWRTRSAIGLGQIDRIEPDGTVAVRPFLPCRSNTIRTGIDRVTPLPELDTVIGNAARTARLLAEGLR